MTVAEVAHELKCSRHHVRHLLDCGLPHINIATGEKRIPRISRPALENWLRDRTRKETQET
jgi:hypothetical protein